VTDGVRVMSLSTSLQHKTNMTTDHLCQIVFNWKLFHIFYAKSLYTENTA